MTLSPRHKLFGAVLLALVAPLIAAAQGASAATAARVLLGLVAAGGIAFWFVRARGGLGTSKFKTAPRLNVVQRVGLSQRTGVAQDHSDRRHDYASSHYWLQNFFLSGILEQGTRPAFFLDNPDGAVFVGQ